MGRRRKSRKVVRRFKKTIPKVFSCPRCGVKAVSVTLKKKEGKAIVKCGNCQLSYEFQITPLLQPVDYYNKFVDRYYHAGG
ncbi:MAG: hypothetical protein B6U69_01490 [Thermofilum sp. ex4484_15]|nr:MAG: hypothetical protein B6U69_01490 [Thermofilum sp. ex4484_15]